MEPSKQELKTLSTAIKVASRYGSEQQKQFNKKRVEKLAEKLKEVQDIPTRKVIIEEIKKHNKKQSFNAVNKAIDDLVSKYKVVVDKAAFEGAGLAPPKGAEIEVLPQGSMKPLTPRIPEYKPGLRGKKPAPPPKETTAAPRPKLTKAQSKGIEKPKEIEEEEKEEKPQPKEPMMEEPEPKEPMMDEPKPKEPMMEEPEPKEPKEPEPEAADIATPPPPDKEPEKPFTRKVEEVKDDLIVDPNINPPSKKMGKSLEDLTVEEINKDLDYFYKNFKNRLKKLKRSKSKNLKVLQRFYRRVLALLRVEKPEEDKKIGVVIKGTDFIKDALKEIISENTIDGLSAEDLLINIEGKEDTQKSDAGAYQFKKGSTSGKIYAEQEPIARLIPTTDEKQVSKMNPKRKLKVNRIPNPKTEYRGLEKTARKMVSRNPFLSAKQPTIKLKKIY